MRTIRCLVGLHNNGTQTNIFCFSCNVIFLLQCVSESDVLDFDVLWYVQWRIVSCFLRLLLIVPRFGVIFLFVRLRISLLTTNMFRGRRVVLVRRVRRIIPTRFSFRISLFLLPRVRWLNGRFPRLRAILMSSRCLVVCVKYRHLCLRRHLRLSSS